jgi:hypothetical protein
LSEDYGNFDSLVPESEADRIVAMKSTKARIKRDSGSGFEPVGPLFVLLSLVGDSHYGDSSNHKLSRDTCRFSELMVDKFLDGPLTEGLIEMRHLRYGVACAIEKPHGLQQEAVLLFRRVEIDFD